MKRIILITTFILLSIFLIISVVDINSASLSQAQAKDVVARIFYDPLIDSFDSTSMKIRELTLKDSMITSYQKEYIKGIRIYSISFNDSKIVNENSIWSSIEIYISANSGDFIGGFTSSTSAECKINSLREVSDECSLFHEKFRKANVKFPVQSFTKIVENCEYITIAKEFSFIYINYSSSFKASIDAWIVYLEGIPPLTNQNINDSLLNQITNYRYVINSTDGSIIHEMQFVNNNF